MNPSDSNHPSSNEINGSSLKRKHEDDVNEEGVEMDYKPTREDIQLVVAAADGNLAIVKSLNESGIGDICFQDPKTGMSVLMAAAGAGHRDVVRYLLDEGAPWNAVDKKFRCAGDYAALNGHQAIIDMMLDHAVMAEMILSFADMEDGAEVPSNLPTTEGAAAMRAATNNKTTPTRLNAAYLSSRLEYTPAGDRLVDTSTQLAVMMDWEQPLMAKHAAWICFADVDPAQRPQGLRTLNVGFGMGIVDGEIMSHSPHCHTIIEAHPQVLEKMQATGWMHRPGVEVCRGRWQDVVLQLEREIAEGKREPFDGVFFDTYAEDDRDLSQFHRHLPHIMSQAPRARYSYYNGMCPDSVFFHGVACETTRLRLERLGFSCEFVPVPVKDEVGAEQTWKNLSSRYWNFDTYFLPQCSRHPPK